MDIHIFPHSIPKQILKKKYWAAVRTLVCDNPIREPSPLRFDYVPPGHCRCRGVILRASCSSRKYNFMKFTYCTLHFIILWSDLLWAVCGWVWWLRLSDMTIRKENENGSESMSERAPLTGLFSAQTSSACCLCLCWCRASKSYSMADSCCPLGSASSGRLVNRRAER